MKNVVMLLTIVGLCASFAPANMVTNGTFDTDISGWLTGGGAIWNPGGHGQLPTGTNLNQWVEGFLAGQTYTLTLDVRATNSYMQWYPWIRLHAGIDGPVVDADYTYDGTTVTAGWYGLPTGNGADYLEMWDTHWTSYEITIVPAADAAARLYLAPHSASWGDVLVDNIVIVPEPVTMVLLAAGALLLRRRP